MRCTPLPSFMSLTIQVTIESLVGTEKGAGLVRAKMNNKVKMTRC